MTMLNPNLCYNKVCYKGTVTYLVLLSEHLLLKYEVCEKQRL